MFVPVNLICAQLTLCDRTQLVVSIPIFHYAHVLTLHVFVFIPNIVPRMIGALCICNLQNVVKFNIFLQKNLCYVFSICSFYWAKRNNRKYLYHAPYYYYYWLTFGSRCFCHCKIKLEKKIIGICFSMK